MRKQILRDIESLDGHTSFLFGKINFLMDATVGFININQNKRVSKLTTFSVVFVPLNIIAGIGGMSEFSMMTQGMPWPLAYGAFRTPGDAPDKPVPSGVPERGVHLGVRRDTRVRCNGPGTGAHDRRAGLSVEMDRDHHGRWQAPAGLHLGAPGRAGA
jgi:hypothetical protein